MAATRQVASLRVITVLLLYISIHVASVSGRYQLEVQPQYYSKVNSGCASCGNRDSCDSEVDGEECDNVFIFCTRQLGEAVTINNIFVIQCVERGQILNGAISSDFIDFDELNTTYRLFFTGESWSGAQVFVVVLDEDGAGPHDVVDVFRAEVVAPLGSGYTNKTLYCGEYNISNLGLSFRVDCSISFFGENCTETDRFPTGNISGGTAAGIIIGCIAAVITLTIIVAVLVILMKRRKYDVTRIQPNTQQSEEPYALPSQGSTEPITDESIHQDKRSSTGYEVVESRLTQSLPAESSTLKKAPRGPRPKLEPLPEASILKKPPREVEEPETPDVTSASKLLPNAPNFMTELKTRVGTKSNNYVDIRPARPAVALKPPKPAVSEKPTPPIPPEKPIAPEKQNSAEEPNVSEKVIASEKPIDSEEPIPLEKPTPPQKPSQPEQPTSDEKPNPPEKPIPPAKPTPRPRKNKTQLGTPNRLSQHLTKEDEEEMEKEDLEESFADSFDSDSGGEEEDAM